MIWHYNGEFLPEEEIKVNPKTQGFQFGYGIFTSFRTNKGKPVLYEKHIKRLEMGCDLIGVCRCQIPPQEIIEELCERNKGTDLRIKVIISLGEQSRSDLMITAVPFKPKYTAKSLKLVSTIYNKIAFRRHKTLNYLENVLSNRNAIIDGYDEGLLANSDNLICECCYDNIFFIKDGQVFTPKADGHILNGVIRQAIIASYPVTEKNIYYSDLKSFDGAFTTNSVQGIVPVRKIDDIEYDIIPLKKLEELEKEWLLK
jgi:4-amino-4-deoxychorismate lyase